MDTHDAARPTTGRRAAVDCLQETWINIDHAMPTPSVVQSELPAPALDFFLSKFEPWHAFEVARWSRSSRDLWWLAPNTPPPLTVSKVLGWKRNQGTAFILRARDDDTPLGYAELNPMRDHRSCFWLGHIVVRPDRRGAGLGRAIMRGLLEESFERRGAERISLIVFPDNLPAIRCYRAAGFECVADEFHRFRGTGLLHRLHRMQINAWGYFEGNFRH